VDFHDLSPARIKEVTTGGTRRSDERISNLMPDFGAENNQPLASLTMIWRDSVKTNIKKN
jgi:hypothetical protein